MIKCRCYFVSALILLLFASSTFAGADKKSNSGTRWQIVKNAGSNGIIQELDTKSLKQQGDILHYLLRTTTADPQQIKKMFNDYRVSYAISNGEINCANSTGRLTKSSTYTKSNSRLSFEVNDSAEFKAISKDTGNDVVFNNYCNKVRRTESTNSKNPNADIKKLLQSAEKGNLSAMNILGGKYYNGDGVPQDRSIAFTFWEEAAKHRHKGAIINMCRYAPEIYLIDSQLGHYCEELGMR